MTPSAEIQPGPHWWKASALTTRHTLPSQLSFCCSLTNETIVFISIKEWFEHELFLVYAKFYSTLQGQIYMQMHDEHIPGYRKAIGRKDWIQRIQVNIKRSQVIENEFVCSLCFPRRYDYFWLGSKLVTPQLERSTTTLPAALIFLTKGNGSLGERVRYVCQHTGSNWGGRMDGSCDR